MCTHAHNIHIKNIEHQKQQSTNWQPHCPMPLDVAVNPTAIAKSNSGIQKDMFLFNASLEMHPNFP